MTREEKFEEVIDDWNRNKKKEKIIKVDVLDKIRAEIEQAAFKDVNGSKYIFVNRVNQIIDKYKAESEEK